MTRTEVNVQTGETRVVELTPEEIAAAQPTLEQAKAQALTDMAAKRYEVEVGGIVVGGVSVQTDRESQKRLDVCARRVRENASYTVRWKGPDGFVTLTAPDILAIADAVDDHVQAAFNCEAVAVQAIDDAETVSEVQAVEFAGHADEVARLAALRPRLIDAVEVLKILAKSPHNITLADMDAAIDADTNLTAAQKSDRKLDLRYTRWRIDHYMVAYLAGLLGITEQQVSDIADAAEVAMNATGD